MKDLVVKLREGVHEILKKYGVHDDVQRGLCSLELATLMTEIVNEVIKERKKQND